MALVTKYKVCRVVTKNEFGVVRYEFVSDQLPTFDFKDEAENWVEGAGQQNTSYVIIEVFTRK
jgi:hypothetical protein